MCAFLLLGDPLSSSITEWQGCVKTFQAVFAPGDFTGCQCQGVSCVAMRAVGKVKSIHMRVQESIFFSSYLLFLWNLGFHRCTGVTYLQALQAAYIHAVLRHIVGM